MILSRNKIRIYRYRSASLILIIILLFVSSNEIYAQNCAPDSFDSVTLTTEIELNGVGQDIDSMDFWKAPDSSESLLFVTSKGSSLVEVWRFPFEGSEQTALTHSTFANSQVNGVIVDQETDRLYVSIGSPSSTVSVFSIPDLSFLFNFNKTGADYQSEPNLALMKIPNGDKRIYVSADDIVFIHDAANGDYISEFVPVTGLETMIADNYHQTLLIPDENGHTGVYVYDPDGNLLQGGNHFGEGYFQEDAEGIAIFRCLNENGEDYGSGFIIVADQRTSQLSEFEVFDREDWHHIGTYHLSDVTNTDGIALTQFIMPGYSAGIFAALDNNTYTALESVATILAAMNPVAVELSAFDAYYTGSTVKIIWTTASELNSNGFEIERSEDINEWEKIIFIKGHDGSVRREYIYEDKNILAGNYYYRLKQIDNDGSFEYSKIIEVMTNEIPNGFSLYQNFPNPFNPDTEIKFVFSNSASAVLKVYDSLGNLIKILFDGRVLAGRIYSVRLHSGDLPSGVYYYTLNSDGRSESRKMLLLK